MLLTSCSTYHDDSQKVLYVNIVTSETLVSTVIDYAAEDCDPWQARLTGELENLQVLPAVTGTNVLFIMIYYG